MSSMMVPRLQTVTCGPVEVDRVLRRATLAGNDLRLTERECALLLCLADRANRVVRRSDVLSEVWALPDDDSNLVAVYIRRLRQKLGKHAEMIVTVRGIGYRLRPSFEAPGVGNAQKAAS
jgi:DNA-binding response OmpR family regulator